MATTLDASTPPSSAIRTPNTPQFGFLDDYRPYSPQKFTPIQKTLKRHQGCTLTDISSRPAKSSSYNLRSHCTPPNLCTKADFNIIESPTSPQTTSKKRVSKNTFLETRGRRISGALNDDTSIQESQLLDLPRSKKVTVTSPRSKSEVHLKNMLPTPAKTPVKRPKKASSSITSIARNLFPVQKATENILLTPKNKNRNKLFGVSSDILNLENSPEPISIYMDSHDRVPDIDRSADNPFYVDSGSIQPKPINRLAKRRKIMVPGEGMQTIEDLEQREDGLIYVFRGKKIFRKFGVIDQEAVDDSDDLTSQYLYDDSSLSACVRRPLTRSSMKPRLLFPPIQKPLTQCSISHETEDEEADTDIEEPSSFTPRKLFENEAATPKAAKFIPMSPPSTMRVTRSKKLDISNLPRLSFGDSTAGLTSQINHSSCAGARVSPFDSWQRTKIQSDDFTKKRSGDHLADRGRNKRSKV